MHSTTECWKPVIGFYGLYEVSNEGRIRSIPSNEKYRPTQSKILKYQISFGYLVVNLFKKGKSHYKRVHRIVAEAFITNPHNKPCVNHKNGIKQDNRLENLEWVTYSENEIHSYKKLGKNIKGNKKVFKNGINPKRKKVICIEKNIVFNSVKEAANSLKLHRANIAAQINGRLITTGGFTFAFI